MAAQSMPSKENTSDREIIISRVFDAPRELVWDAWTDPKKVVFWWGPQGFSTTIEEMDVRPGGKWVHVMRGPDGTHYPNKSVFSEVVKPERIVYSHGGGKEGGPGVSFTATWTFEEVDKNKTRLTIHQVFGTAEQRDMVVKQFNAIEGGNQTLGRLSEYLGAPEAFTITRTFDAPLDLVFKAYAEEERLAKWWGPKGFEWVSGKLDFRPGGRFHYCMRSPDGHDMWGKFEYFEVAPPTRLVFASSFSDPQGNTVRAPFAADFPLQIMNTLVFSEHNGKTTIAMRGVPYNATQAERDFFLKMHPSMQQGYKGTLDQLEQYLATL